MPNTDDLRQTQLKIIADAKEAILKAEIYLQVLDDIESSKTAAAPAPAPITTAVKKSAPAPAVPVVAQKATRTRTRGAQSTAEKVTDMLRSAASPLHISEIMTRLGFNPKDAKKKASVTGSINQHMKMTGQITRPGPATYTAGK